jgi:Cu-Zn family superoxide dismutase
MYFSSYVTLIYIIAIVLVNSTQHDLGIESIFDDQIISDADFDSDLEVDHETEIAEPLNKHEVRAVAVLRGFSHTVGLIHLVQHGSGPTHITGTIAGLRPLGSHGFHFHERPVTGGCESAGEHYNPTRRNHGGPNDINSHVGDLGNVDANIKGVSKVDIIDHKISLIGRYSVIGRSLVVHVRTDDLGTGYNRESKQTGNSGGRLACGTVRFVHFKKP